MSNSVQPQRQQPTCPCDSPGKNTGVGCHFLLQCMKVKSESEVAQSCPTLSNPMDCSLPDSSVHGIFQARVLEWGAIAFSPLTLCHCKDSRVLSLGLCLSCTPLSSSFTAQLPFCLLSAALTTLLLRASSFWSAR